MQILIGSPHPHGTTDAIAHLLAEAAAHKGARPHTIHLRDTPVQPCINCGFCTTHPDTCPLDAEDQGGQILNTLRQDTHPIFVLPVYFYGPPALFKALIDRAQRYWALPPRTAPRPAHAVFCAARIQGERLFEANLLIMRCFLRALGLYLEQPLLLRGLESPADLAANPACREQVLQWGARWGAQEHSEHTDATRIP